MKSAHSWHFSLFRSRKEVRKIWTILETRLTRTIVFISIVAICMKADKVIFCFTLDPSAFFSYLVFFRCSFSDHLVISIDSKLVLTMYFESFFLRLAGWTEGRRGRQGSTYLTWPQGICYLFPESDDLLFNSTCQDVTSELPHLLCMQN